MVADRHSREDTEWYANVRVLMEQVRCGDQNALHAFVAEATPRLQRIGESARKRLVSGQYGKALAEDAVQDFAAKLLTGEIHLPDSGDRSWSDFTQHATTTISRDISYAMNRAAEEAKGQGEYAAHRNDSQHRVQGEAVDLLADPQRRSLGLEAYQRSTELNPQVIGLTSLEVVNAYEAGKTSDEIAGAMECSPAYVRQIRNRATDKLQIIGHLHDADEPYKAPALNGGQFANRIKGEEQDYLQASRQTILLLLGSDGSKEGDAKVIGPLPLEDKVKETLFETVYFNALNHSEMAGRNNSIRHVLHEGMPKHLQQNTTATGQMEAAIDSILRAAEKISYPSRFIARLGIS